jgi:WS/DGAT/MGAT family acyltransferase
MTRRLNGFDAVFLSVETPANHLHVMAAMVLDPSTVPGGYSFEAMRNFIARRLPMVPPMSRRIVEVPLRLERPVWVNDPDFDVDRHLRRAALPSPGGPRELAELAAEIAGQQLDRDRPLWEMIVVEGLAQDRIALLAKLHHCMMDGAAGVQFMAAFFGRGPEPEETEEVPPEPPERLPGDLEMLLGAIPSMASRPLRLARAAGYTAWGTLRRRLRGGSQEVPPAVPVPRTLLNARTTRYRSVAFTRLPLQETRELARAQGVTVNDVVLASVSGSLRAFLQERDQLPDEPLVACVPVSVHKEGDSLANAYSVLYCSLATDVEDPLERLQAIFQGTQRAKQREREFGSENMEEWANIPSPLASTLVGRLYTDLHLFERTSLLCNAVVSNVPGPPMPLYFGGARLLELYPLGPIYDGMALNLTVLSREDTLDVGLVGAREPLPDLWEIADAVPAAFAELRAALGARGPRPVNVRSARRASSRP